MKKPPTLEAIYAAELRVVQARQRTRDSLIRARVRARVAVRATLARPLTLGLVAVAAGACGFWLMRRGRTRRAAVSAGVATKTSVAGLLVAFAMRYGRPALPFILRRARVAWQQRALHASAATRRPPVRNYRAPAGTVPPAGPLD
ncbi:MAG: hypothetical protein ABIS45_04670 [Burkholderiales bacterium]